MTKLFTIGHSTRSIEEFVELLNAHAVAQLVDIRTIPKSRHNPQFGQDELAGALQQRGIEYVYIKELGGLRSAARQSMNEGWRNKSFRNYADYMQTEPFSQGLQQLMALARQAPTAIMCAEAVPWRCHRSLVGDALLVHGLSVDEIISSGNTRPHALTSFAKVEGANITYPKPPEEGTADAE